MGDDFTVPELQTSKAFDVDLAEHLGDADHRQVGNRLRLLAGRQRGPFRLERIGRDHDGAIWKVYLVDADTQAC